MSDWICTECGGVEPSYEAPGEPPFCPECGMELSPAEDGVLKLVTLDKEADTDG